MSSDTAFQRVSPSRTYVAVCFRGNFAGYYFKKFVLPELKELENNAAVAIWYYLNRIDIFGCVDGCFTFEDFSDVTDAKIEE